MNARAIACGVAFLALAAASQAALEWESTVQESRSTPAQEKALAVFRFKNTGATAVTIASIRSSCGCTTAHLEKRRYAPGERGEIVADFRFGSRTGMQEKTVTVTTDEAGAPTVNLVLRVMIEEALTVLPSLVFWRLGDAPAPRQIELRAAAGQPLSIASVESADPNFKPQLQTVKEGERYLLTIEPASTAARATTTLTIKASAAGGASSVFKAFAIVR
jgi:Protein of unknown function (DUF1573)